MMNIPFSGLRSRTTVNLRQHLRARAPLELRMPAVTLAAAVLAGCGGGDSAPQPPALASAQSMCDAFLGRTIEGAVVTQATFVPTADNTPEHCIVRGEMPQDLDFQVTLPTDWNQRTVFQGTGGFAGNFAASNPYLATHAYATITSNHGHTAGGLDPEFALDAQMLEEYSYLAVPRVMGPAKAIIQERYGDKVSGTKMVYDGCSGGGRQGLIQAQRYPDLFDGVISRAPANAFTPQFLWYQKVERQLAQPGGALSSAKMQAISGAVLAKCDALDGLADKMIGRPDACTFDPVELACTGAETDSCLTPPQVESARAFYAPTDVANGRYKWPGFPVGGEAEGWTNQSARTLLGLGYMNYMITQSPSGDWLQVDPTQYTSRIDQMVTMIDAVDPDLSRFKASGGKLILWTGLTDWLITTNNATDYYKSVVAKAGGQAAADEFVEYYTSPGVQHCRGGTGADAMDLVGPMFEWLEKDVKPSSSQIIATQATVPAGATPASRPLCQYPQYPKYVSGDPNAAASFVCTAP